MCIGIPSRSTTDVRAHNPSTPDKLGHLILKSPTIKDYIGTPVDHSKKMMIGLANHQPTSPQKAGAMIWEVCNVEYLADIACTLRKSTGAIVVGQSCC